MTKQEALILYVVSKFENYKELSKTKLNKIFWFIDCAKYRKYFEVISEFKYKKNHYGPVVDRIENIYDKLVKEGFLLKKNFLTNDCSTTSYIALKDPDLSYFNNVDIKIIDDIVSEFEEKSANHLSDLSHNDYWGSKDIGSRMFVTENILGSFKIEDSPDHVIEEIKNAK